MGITLTSQRSALEVVRAILLEGNAPSFPCGVSRSYGKKRAIARRKRRSVSLQKKKIYARKENWLF